MVTFSHAKLSDCSQIVQLEELVRDEKGVANIYETASFIEHGYVFVAKDKSKIIGAIVTLFSKKNLVFVCDFVVDPKYRNQGIGYRLYKKLLQVVQVPVQAFVGPGYQQSIYLHEKLGFKRIKTIEKPYGSGIDPRYLYRLDRK